MFLHLMYTPRLSSHQTAATQPNHPPFPQRNEPSECGCGGGASPLDIGATLMWVDESQTNPSFLHIDRRHPQPVFFLLVLSNSSLFTCDDAS